jgi:hypothetical protein
MSGCRGPIERDDDVPRVHLWCIGDREPDSVASIEHGIEEERVSWVTRSGFEGESIAIACEAALESALKIGISVSADGRIVIHHKQLPDERPLYDIAGVEDSLARTLGSNAARLAKGTPLKSID